MIGWSSVHEVRKTGANEDALPRRPSAIQGRGPGTKAFLICAVAALLIGQVWLFRAMLPAALAGRVDFLFFYRAGQIVDQGQGHKLYDIQVYAHQQAGTRLFNHPAYEALVYAPLAHLSYRHAYEVWTLAGAAFLLAGTLAIGLNPLLCFAFFPVVVALAQGQNTLLLFAIFAFAFREYRTGRETSAGALLGLGLIQFQFTLPLVAILALRRKWRLVAGFGGMAAILAGISLLVVGPHGLVEYVHVLLKTGTQETGVMPNLHGLVGYLGGGFLPTVLLSAVVALWSGMKRVSTRTQEFSLALIASILVSFHCFVTCLPLLLIPMAAEFEEGRWYSLIFFATPLYLLLFQLGMWSLISLGLVAFLLGISFRWPAVAAGIKGTA